VSSEQLPSVIKLYPNLRLYDGESGSYRSLLELKAWKKREIPFLILDSRTGNDVTDRIPS
jgi:polyhydroxyalkanoate synthesis regulator protein